MGGSFLLHQQWHGWQVFCYQVQKGRRRNEGAFFKIRSLFWFAAISHLNEVPAELEDSLIRHRLKMKRFLLLPSHNPFSNKTFFAALDCRFVKKSHLMATEAAVPIRFSIQGINWVVMEVFRLRSGISLEISLINLMREKGEMFYCQNAIRFEAVVKVFLSPLFEGEMKHAGFNSLIHDWAKSKNYPGRKRKWSDDEFKWGRGRKQFPFFKCLEKCSHKKRCQEKKSGNFERSILGSDF